MMYKYCFISQDSELTQERLIRDDLLHQTSSMCNFEELDSMF